MTFEPPIQIIRNLTLNKRPNPATLREGQPAVNLAPAQPGFFFADSTGTNLFKVGPCHVGVTAPNAGAVGPSGALGNSKGEQWLDITDSVNPVFKVWNGISWDSVTLNNALSPGTVTGITAGTGLTGGTINLSGTIGLANTSVVPGSYTNANVSIDSQGRVTAASNGTSGTVTSVTAGTGLSGGSITSTGTIRLANTAVTPGTYNFATLTIDAQGRVTNASSGSTINSVAPPGTQSDPGNTGDIAFNAQYFFWYDGVGWQRVKAQTAPW